MFELKFRYRFEAAHRFTQSCADTCATPHGHTWYATLTFSTQLGSLNSDQMVHEFGDLKAPWKRFLDETVDHSFLHHENDPILPALRDHIPEFRGLPFPGDPTTELIAQLFFEKALRIYEPLLRKSPSLKIESVTIEETPTNHVTYRPSRFEAFARSGWWSSDDALRRL